MTGDHRQANFAEYNHVEGKPAPARGAGSDEDDGAFYLEALYWRSGATLLIATLEHLLKA